MAFIGTVLQEAVKRSKKLLIKNKFAPYYQQEKVLKKLVQQARNTSFGREYGFIEILKSEKPTEVFKKQVPVFDYNLLHKQWWHKTISGEENVCWPGKIKHFALTSGTSEAASKYIPVSINMIRSIRQTSLRQTLTLSDITLPGDFYEKGILMLGGSTSLKKENGYYCGDLSGILASKLPLWFHRFYKPGRILAQEPDWGTKLDKITREAKNWDIGIIAGVPAWVKILIEKIIAYYNVKNIHEIWPNFKIFVHGGVSFEPYKESFNSLMGKEVFYLETYLASEGFMAFQYANRKYMQLVLDKGIFFEFVPFNEKNFDSNGQLKNNPEVLTINQVKEDTDYAILISTCSGTWRYLIGDTIRFKNLHDCEIVITGRTKHFLSLCGEHLSVDNMIAAIKLVSEELQINITEFSVAGIPHEGLFAHKWFIGTNQKIDNNLLRNKIDSALCKVNDDYVVERKHALKEIFVECIPTETFYNFLKHIGREGGQNKFPRVLKGEQLKKWEIFLEGNKNK